MPNIDNNIWQQLIFYFFATLASFSAAMVISVKNPVRAVLFLILTFFATAATWLVIEIEFLAMVLVLVYVGAVMVLFLFVVMMLNVELASLQASFTRYLPVGICIVVLLLILLIRVAGPNDFGKDSVISPIVYPKDFNSMKILGELLFTKYLLHLEIAGILLLAAIISAIRLTLRGSRYRKTQKIADQVKVNAQDRLRLINIPSANVDRERIR